MNSARKYITRHFMALVGSTIVFANFSVVLYVSLVMISSDWGGPLTCIAAPFFNGLVAALFFPISVLLEHWLVDKLESQAVGLYLAVGTMLSIVGLGLILVGALLLGALFDGGQWRESLLVVAFYGGIPLLLGGPLYWFILCISRGRDSGCRGED